MEPRLLLPDELSKNGPISLCTKGLYVFCLLTPFVGQIPRSCGCQEILLSLCIPGLCHFLGELFLPGCNWLWPGWYFVLGRAFGKVTDIWKWLTPPPSSCQYAAHEKNLLKLSVGERYSYNLEEPGLQGGKLFKNNTFEYWRKVCKCCYILTASLPNIAGRSKCI